LTKLAGASNLVAFPKPATLAVRDKRILSHLHLVDLIARTFKKKLPPCFDFDDLKGAGNIGLLHAAERYQPTRKVPFEKYARRRIEDAIRESIRRKNWAPATLVELEPSMTAAIADPTELPDEPIARLEEGREVARAIGQLPPKERAVIHLVYVRGESEEKVGARMGVHRNTVRLIRAEGVRQLRRHFAIRGRRVA
jgi:RNA polymerase sigma factor (sigma-70 family)